MNEENLKRNSERTPSERKKLARKAGIASGAKRRENKKTRELIQIALETIDAETGYTLKEKAVLSVVNAAVAGDLKAFELVTKLAGDWKENEASEWDFIV